MGISKEVKVGLIGLVVLVGTIILFNYLKRQNAFSANMIVTARLDRVDFVKVGNPVFVQGRQLGTVTAVYKVDNNYFLDLDLDPEALIPKNAKASVVSTSILGGTSVALIYDKPCQSNCLAHGDRIEGTMDRLQQQAERTAIPILESMDTALTTLLDDSLGMQALIGSAYASLASLKKNTDGFKNSMYGSSKTLPQTISNLRKMTEGLSTSFVAADAAQQTAIDSLLATLSSFTPEEMEAMTEVLYKAKEELPKLPAIVAKADSAIIKANGGLDKANDMLKSYEKGNTNTIAKLLHDKSLKDSTQLKIQKLAIDLSKIRNNPQNHVTLRKKK